MAFTLFNKKTAPTGPISYIVAGLGNPGAQYDKTRHNAGFWAVDRLAKQCGAEIKSAKYQALIAKTELNGQSVLLMKPQTMMNASGAAVAEAASFYKIPPDHVIILCDDITQVPGKIRIRRKGSAGGHNGLKSIIACLGSEEFARVRIGVGEKPNPEYDLAAWVLGKMPESDYNALQSRLDDVCNAVSLILTGDFEKAMSLYNG